jgi:hypothetical protein
MEGALRAGNLVTTALLLIPFAIGVVSGILALAAVHFALYVTAAWKAGFAVGARVKPEPKPHDLSGVA